MPRFFTGEIDGETAVIRGEDARHMALSLRMKAGEQVVVCDCKGNDYHCVISEIAPQIVQLQVQQTNPSASEPGVFVTLYQAMPKGDKFEGIVQKSVELGVGRIVPMLTHRCISRPDEKSMRKKILRYERIALEAAKQSGRGIVPQIGSLLNFEQAIGEVCAKGQTGILFYENADLPLRGTLAEFSGTQISIFIGSEGGFELSEASYAREEGFSICSLGSRILRCETAPLAAISAMMYALGEM